MSQQNNILFVNFKKYASILEGGGIANQRNINAATSLLGDANVAVLYATEEDHPQTWQDKLHQIGLMRHGYWNGVSKEFIRKIIATAPAYKTVFLSTSLFGMIAKELKDSGYNGQVIVHFHNVESIYYRDAISDIHPIKRLAIRCARENDEKSCRYADKIITLNERDSKQLEKLYHRQADMILPISIQDRLEKTNINTEALTGNPVRCLFVGSNFKANRDALSWWMNNVMPKVNIRLQIVGKGMNRLRIPPGIKERITIASDVADVSPYYAESDIVVLPIWKGSGMKVKTCEALMYGKNILGTPEAWEGYEADYAKVGAKCKNADEFISAIRRIERDPIKQFNVYSREVYEKRHTPQDDINRLKELISL